MALGLTLTVATVAWFAWSLARKPGPVALLPFPDSAHDYYMLDDLAGHVHRPDTERVYTWPEHPEGRIVARTNNLGFREDEPTPVDKPAGVLRVLVTGDSHVDGVVPNHESFTSRLERLLAPGASAPGVELLNGGVGHYGPHNYAGFLEKHLPLRPDAYIVVLYEGNDFLDAVRAEVVAGRLDVPDRPPDYLERLNRAKAQSSGAVDQGLNQLYFFKTFPQLRGRAVDITEEKLRRVAKVCMEDGIQFRVLTLPAKLDVEPATIEGLERLRGVLELSDEDLQINRQMSAALHMRLSGAGIDTSDLLPTLAHHPGPLYWNRDHHLNSTGHALLAAALFETWGRGGEGETAGTAGQGQAVVIRSRPSDAVW